MEQNKDQRGAAVRGEAVETQPGSSNFDGAAAYEAFLGTGGYGAQLVPKWAGQFDTHQQWVNKAASWLKSPDWNRPVCVDSLGRRMALGMDMAKARDEGTFPVRYFWECELAPASARAADAPSQPSELVLRFGAGLIEVGQGHHGDNRVPAILFGRNGAGTVGVETEGDRVMLPGECIAALTFDNPESLDVVAEKLAELRARIWPESRAADALDSQPTESTKDAK